MNYIQLINRFWLLQEEVTFCPTDIALFFYLLKVNNQCAWKETFRRNNTKTCADLGISFNTMSNSRKRLAEAHVISFSGKTGCSDVTYIITLSKIDELTIEQSATTQPTTLVVTSIKTSSKSDEVVATKDKVNKTKVKQIKQIKRISESTLPVIEKISLLKLETTAQPVNDFYQKITAAWFVFYKNTFNIKPTFGALEGKKLKSIISKLEMKSREQNFEWTEDSAEQAINKFLTVAISDKWIKENLTLSLLDSKFDTIIVKAIKNNYANSTSTTQNVFGNW
jgi:hypothetical protein